MFKKHFSNFIRLSLYFLTRLTNDNAGARQEKSVFEGKWKKSLSVYPSIFSTTVQPIGFVHGAHKVQMLVSLFERF